MNEQQFIYGKLKHLQDQVEFLTDIVDKQGKMIGNVLEIIEKIQSPEYASKLAKTAQMVEIAEKLKMIREIVKNK